MPAIFSIVVFSTVFIFLIVKNSNNTQGNLQVSPQDYLYNEKFGETKPYDNSDISSIGFVTNIRVNQIPGVSEPKIVCSPIDKNILVISSNNFNQNKNSAQIFISKDAGINWKASEIPLSQKFKNSSYTDSYVDYDSDGNLLYVSVQFDLNNDFREGIFFAKSSDNGNTWKTDFNFIDYNGKENIELDRPKIYVDKFSETKNVIFVTWIEVKGITSFIMFSKSSDGGDTFTAPMQVEKNDVQYSSLNTNSKGDLFLTFLKEESKIFVKKSIDGGVSWVNSKQYIKINPAGVKTENHFVIKNSLKKGIRINSEPSTVISKNGDLLLTYSARGEGNDLADIFFAKLNINTGDYTKPIRVNNDNTSCDQFLPAITIDERNDIVIMYQDSRNDINNIQTETYVSVLSDGGLKFYNEKISTHDFNARQVSVEQYIGDYNSCLFSGDKFVGVWTDGRNSNLDIYAGTFSIKEFIENMNH
ncbi:MAG: sialidase family protein [bacterium]